MQMPTAEDVVSRSILGHMNTTNNDELGVALHDAAINGHKRKLKKILTKGIDVDYMNAAGQTALFCACFEGQESVISILLQHGANPNHRCDVGSTPVHAAGYSCNPKILSALIEAGGDMRLHDSKGRTVRYWAICNPDNKKRRKMIEYIEKTRYFALTYTGRDILQKQSSQHLSLQADNSRASVTTSLMNLLKFKGIARKSLFTSSVHSFGYGKIYFGNGEYLGSVATVPLVAEGALKHDEFAPNYFNGPFMVMEGMKWNKTLVTVKRLHKQPAGDSTVDMLIRENDYMARLRHPNILLLMGLCQTNNLEGLVLIYERVGCGSLFHCLHQKSESLSRYSMCELLLQVSDALLYVHQQNLLHCSLTSHAIQLITPTVAKLNNFEYMVERELPEYPTSNDVSAAASSRSFSIVEEQIQHGPYNWLAPEILGGAGPTVKSDLYSLCAVMWEIIHGNIPWGELMGPQIKTELVERKNTLKVSEKVKNPFNVLLYYGLNSDPDERNLTVEQFRDIMSQIVMDHERTAAEQDKGSPRASRTYKSFKSWMAPKSKLNDGGPAAGNTTEEDTGLSADEKENPFFDFVLEPGTGTPAGPAKGTPSSKGKTLTDRDRQNSDRISKMSINAAIGSSRVTVRTSGDPLWREKIDIIRQSQIPSGGFIAVDRSATAQDRDKEWRTMPAMTKVRTLGGTASAASSSAQHRSNLKQLRDELERSKRSFFEAPASDSWHSTASLPRPNKYAPPPPGEPRAAKPGTAPTPTPTPMSTPTPMAMPAPTPTAMPTDMATPTGYTQSNNGNNNICQLRDNSSLPFETSDSEVNPFKLYHTENVIAEIKAVLATRPINKYKSTSTFLPSSLNKVHRSTDGELLKHTVYGALANPFAKYMRSQRVTTNTSHTSHVDGEHTTVTTTTSRVMRAHITPVSRYSVTPSSRGSAAIAGNTSDFNRSSWSGSWTLSFDNNEDHSCKPASHCLLRESTPINTKDSNSLPKPPDFAWPQSQQSSTSRLVTPPIVRWSRTKPTQLSPAVKKALSYHGSTQQREQYSSERVSCHPEHPEHPERPAPAVEVEVGDMRETPTKGAGPPEPKRKDWSSGPRSVRDLIRKFQGHVEEHLRKQTSHCTRKNSQKKKTATNVGVFSARSTPVVRTRDYSAFYSTEYRRPTPLVTTATVTPATSSSSYLQKIVRKSTERLSGIMRRSLRQDNTADSGVFRQRSPSPTPPARPPPPPRHDMSYLSTSTDGSELTPSDVIISTDDSEDVSVLVDRVIHDAHKQVTVEARTSGRLSQGQQDTSGLVPVPPLTSLPKATSSDPAVRSTYTAGVTDDTATALHRDSCLSNQECHSKSLSSAYAARGVSNLGTQAACDLGAHTASGVQTAGAGYFSATVSGSGACQHCYTQRFSNISRLTNRRVITTSNDGEYDDEPTDVNSRRADAELEDLYFDDELCTENICRLRHLRLQSPSADTPVVTSGGNTGGTTSGASLTKTATTVKTYGGVRLQSESSSQRSSVTESEMKRLKVIEDEPRTSLPPLMEVDSDDSEFLRKVLDPNNDIGYYATVRVDSFDKHSPLLVDSKSSRCQRASGDATGLPPSDTSDQMGDSNTDDAPDA